MDLGVGQQDRETALDMTWTFAMAPGCKRAGCMEAKIRCTVHWGGWADVVCGGVVGTSSGPVCSACENT